LYEEELVRCGRKDTVAMDVQLIKGVLPDLFAVLKFLESDDNLVFDGIICHYFIKNCKSQRVSSKTGGKEIVMLSENQSIVDVLWSVTW